LKFTHNDLPLIDEKEEIVQQRIKDLARQQAVDSLVADGTLLETDAIVQAVRAVELKLKEVI
jgi:hypothetical protein